MFFFYAFVVLVPLAALFPNVACSGGLIRPEISIFWIDVMAIFFVEGLMLPTQAMVKAATRVEVHLMSQLFNLLFIPLATQAATLKLVALGWMDERLVDGFLALGCMPCTTSMCVMLSGRSAGDAPLAAFNAILSNTIAVFYTPALLAHMTHIDPNASQAWLAGCLCLKMILPQSMGQLARRVIGHTTVTANMPKIAIVNQVFILMLLWQILSDVFKQAGSVTLPMLIATLAVAAGLHYLFFATAWLAGRRLAPPERVAFLFTGTTKTVVLGVPMLKALFGDRPPSFAAALLLPLVSYHLLELANGLVLSARLKTWVTSRQAASQLPMLAK